MKKGDIVTCPDCGLELLEVVRDLYVREQISVSMFKLLTDKIEFHVEAPTRCVCGALYFAKENGLLHTKNGWVGGQKR